MTWNIAPECISTVILCIIWIYSRKGNPIPSLKNKLFQACFLVTFTAMITNILSTFLITNVTPFSLIPAWIVTTIYFIATPLMGMVYYLYAFANLCENEKVSKWNIALNMLPGLLYVAVVFLNLWIHTLFNITLENGYTQEKDRMLTYLIFYLYCVLSVVLVALKRKSVPRPIRVILFTFPLIAALVVVVQLMFPDIILSGSAATCALLLIYLFLQNKQISIDYLTGIPKRQEFLSMLEVKLKKSPAAPFAVIVLSLMEFKQINDIHGQHVGDGLLVTVSDFLKKQFALKEEQIYRYSGDEFALLLNGADDARITDMTDRITARMASVWEVGECSCFLKAALGIIRYPETTTEMSSLINGIEYSILLAKSDGRHRHICHCDAAVLQKASRRQQVRRILRQCLREDGFEVYYQPIYNVSTRQFTNAEALLRINHSPLGPLAPGEFIPIAEESGLIIEITYMVLRRVCQLLRRMEDQGIAPDAINVNFSSLQFTQANLMEELEKIIRESGISPSRLDIEITESTLADNPESIMDFTNRAQEMGIRVCVDDFGTGYSNLSSVISLPFDTIKIDKSLIYAAMKNKRSSIVVQNLTRTFDELGNTVLAEGVETEEQRQFVEDCGCGLIQGFLYARPMPEKDFEAFMKENAKLPSAV